MRPPRAVLFATLGWLLAPACRAPQPVQGDVERLAELRARHARLHAQLEDAVGKDPVVAEAFADPGQVVIAARAQFVEQLAAQVAQRYLARVELDLASVEARADGKVRSQTPIGRKKVGEWVVEVEVLELASVLRAQSPRVRLGNNRLTLDLPVDVQPSSAKVALRLAWDATGLVGVVCKDFQIEQDLSGRVLSQRHTLHGALALSADAESVSATPEIPDRHVRLQIEVDPASWETVAQALRSQDTPGRCGLVLDPEKVLEHLRGIAAEGIKVRLPKALLRVVHLPAHVSKQVRVGERPVQLSVQGARLTTTRGLLWSSASVRVLEKP